MCLIRLVTCGDEALLHPPDRSLLGRVHLELATVLRLVREALELMIAIGSEAALAFLGTRLQVCELWQEVLCVVCLIKLWQIGRGHRLLADGVPVDLREPWVALDLLSIGRSTAQTLVWVLMQQLHAQVTCILCQEVIVEFWLRILDVLIELLTVF